MSDQNGDARQRSGSKDDRKFATKDALALGGVLGLVTGASDWLVLQCYAGGTWHWVAPSKDLVEGVAYVMILPAVLWLSKVFSLIGTIITNRLQKDAGT